MYITFSSYLDDLKSKEGIKPPHERKPVPTMRDIAAVLGKHEASLYKIVNGNVTRLNLEISQGILDEMWRRGFTPTLNDFMVYIPPEVDSE